jgi:hypothetical protein
MSTTTKWIRLSSSTVKSAGSGGTGFKLPAKE